MNCLNRVPRLVLLSAAAALTLAACDTVEFQSPPSEPLAACDPALVGDWRAEDFRREPGEGMLYLRITDNCERWYSVGIERDEQGNPVPDVDDLEEEMELGFAHSGKQAFIVARDRPDPAKESSPEDKPNGYTLIAFDRDEANIILRQIDLKAVAHLIVDDVVPGWIEKRDRRPDGSGNGYASGFWVYVFGSVEETSALLDAHQILDAPWMRLLPVEASDSADIDGWLAGADQVKTSTFEAKDKP